MLICTQAVRQTFGAGAAGVGAAFSVLAAARLACTIPAGLAGDRLGRRPLLVGGPLLVAAGESLHGGLWDNLHPPPPPPFPPLLLEQAALGTAGQRRPRKSTGPKGIFNRCFLCNSLSALQLLSLPLHISLVSFGVAGEMACAAARPPHLWALLAARAVHGAGAAVLAAGMELTVGDITVPATRARTLGIRQV